MVILITSYPQKQLYKLSVLGTTILFCTIIIHSKPFRTTKCCTYVVPKIKAQKNSLEKES